MSEYHCLLSMRIKSTGSSDAIGYRLMIRAIGIVFRGSGYMGTGWKFCFVATVARGDPFLFANFNRFSGDSHAYCFI